LSNKDIALITLKGGSKFSGWVEGAGGTGTFGCNANGWLNGLDNKYWEITISTVGYENLTLSSKQRGSNTGPRDFKVQYSTDGLMWVDVPSSAIIVAGNFTTGVLNSISLPIACENQPNLQLRWIMTTNDGVSGAMAAAGTNRIDDIIIKGDPGTFANDATVNPNNFIFNIDNPTQLKTTITWNDASTLVRITNSNIPPDTLVLNTDYTLLVDTITFLVPYLQTQYITVGQNHFLSAHFDVGNSSIVTITWDNDSLYSAEISPDTAYYDLSAPTDVFVTLTWNDATSITGIIDDQGTPYNLVLNTDYTVSGTTLTILDSYLSAIFVSPGQEINLGISFDQGGDALLTIQSFLSPPAPNVIALWDFEDAVKRGLIIDNASFMANPYSADDGTTVNIDNSPILLYGGSSFSGWVAGSGGTGTWAPNSNGWDSGALVKFWQIDISTEGYGNITLSSKQRSSSSGPANFKVQYSIDGSVWTDVPGSDIVVAENFTSGVLTDISLPVACNNATTLFLRWIMKDDVSVGGSAVGSTGTNRIDDIVVKGNYITNEANILSYSFIQQTAPAFIDTLNKTVDIEVSYGTSRLDLVASFVLSPNATAEISGVPQVSGDTDNNFTNPVEYLITAGDAVTTKLWTVTVTVADPSSETKILDFSFAGHATTSLDIDDTTSIVNILIVGTTLNDLVAEFTLSSGATAEISGILQESGVTINSYSTWVTYTIIAEDGVTERNWTIKAYLDTESISETDPFLFSVFPNPVGEILHIQTDVACHVSVINSSGQVLFCTNIDAGLSEIPADKLGSGIFFVQLTSADKSKTLRIVVE
jgi:hypothetical protein